VLDFASNEGHQIEADLRRGNRILDQIGFPGRVKAADLFIGHSDLGVSLARFFDLDEDKAITIKSDEVDLADLGLEPPRDHRPAELEQVVGDPVFGL